jgi:Uma2 family endonuclease
MIEGPRPHAKEEAVMSTASVTPPALLSARQFAQRPDPEYPAELVRGRIVPTPVPKPGHGEICSRVGRIFGNWVEDHDLGRVLGNDMGVITERDPDTVRGAEISYYSYARIPRGPVPDEYPDAAPELIVEVLSPSDRRPKVLAKVAEYLDSGTTVVIILDDQRRLAHLYRVDGTTSVLGADQEVTLPDLLGDFRVRVGRFFE